MVYGNGGHQDLNLEYATVHKNLGASLNKSGEKYKPELNYPVEGLVVIYIIFDTEGNPIDYEFIDLNPLFEKQTGIKSVINQLKGAVKLDEEENYLEILGRVALTGESRCFQYYLSGKNNWYSFFVFKTGAEGLGQVATFVKNITKSIREKEELKKRLSLKKEMCLNVAHELKTPLNVIFSADQLMLTYLKKETIEDFRGHFLKNINIIKQNCYRLMKLISNIVDISKMDAGYFNLVITNVNIVKVVRDIIDSITQYVNLQNRQIVFLADQEEIILACDPEKIERMMLNLISNGIKFSHANDEIVINIRDQGEWAEISVKDNGIGMDKDYLKNIFQRFSQENRELPWNAQGSGIGMSIVKSIVDLHGGRISVESEIGQGSNFRIQLPVKVVPEKPNEIRNSEISSPGEMIQVEFSDIYNL